MWGLWAIWPGALLGGLLSFFFFCNNLSPLSFVGSISVPWKHRFFCICWKFTLYLRLLFYCPFCQGQFQLQPRDFTCTVQTLVPVIFNLQETHAFWNVSSFAWGSNICPFLILGEVIHQVLRILKQPLEKTMWEETEASHELPAPTCQPYDWTSLEPDLTAPIDSDDCSSPSYISTACSLMRHPGPEPTSSIVPEFVTHPNSEFEKYSLLFNFAVFLEIQLIYINFTILAYTVQWFLAHLLLCNHCHCLIPDYFHHLKRISHTS